MNHKFTKVQIPQGYAKVEETCKHCGVASVRYTSGARSYFDNNGKITSKGTQCTGDMNGKPVIVKTQQPFIKPVSEIVATTNHIPPIFKSQPKQINNNIEVEARLKDAMILLKIAYEDLVKNDINSKARQMLGRYLYSSGYQELVIHLDKKSQL